MKKSITLILMIVMVVVSCTKEKGAGITGIPYQETEKGQWSMLSTDGEIIFADEFKNKPTVVKEGMFMVKNNNNLWEIYKADKKPLKIGGEYISATLFEDGKALVCERNKHVSIIDKKGNTIKVLSKIDNKEVGEVRNFSEGYSIYKTGDYYGAINDNGEPIIPAELGLRKYSFCLKFIAINKKYEKEYKADSIASLKYTVLDTKGKKIMELNGAKYCKIGSFQDGLLPVCVKKDGSYMWGIINEKEETIVKPTEKLKEIGEISGDSFTYYNGEGWGLMSITGETLIRAKYDGLRFDCDNIMVTYTTDNEGKSTYKFIDKGDNPIGKDSYIAATAFYMLEGEHALVQVSDKQWSLINKKGESLEKLPDMVNISFDTGDYIIESDFVDIAKMLDELKITQNGLEGITFNSTPKNVVELLAKYSWRGDETHSAKSAYWYDYTSEFTYSRDVTNVKADVAISFTGNMSRQTFKTNRVIDYAYGDWYWYHDEQIPTGYVWNNVNISSFKLSFEHNGKMYGKLRMTLNELAKRFKSMGKVVKENNGAVVVALNNKKTAFVYMEPTCVHVIWGNIGSAESINIDKYEDVKEDMGSEQLSSNGIDWGNDYCDTLCADTTDCAVDTAYAW